VEQQRVYGPLKKTCSSKTKCEQLWAKKLASRRLICSPNSRESTAPRQEISYGFMLDAAEQECSKCAYVEMEMSSELGYKSVRGV
jgi:hypothetical protein